MHTYGTNTWTGVAYICCTHHEAAVTYTWYAGYALSGTASQTCNDGTLTTPTCKSGTCGRGYIISGKSICYNARIHHVMIDMCKGGLQYLIGHDIKK